MTAPDVRCAQQRFAHALSGSVLHHSLGHKGSFFAGQVRDPDRRPIGFDLRAAAEASRFQGFYLFQSFGLPGSGTQPGPRACQMAFER